MKVIVAYDFIHRNHLWLVYFPILNVQGTIAYHGERYVIRYGTALEGQMSLAATEAPAQVCSNVILPCSSLPLNLSPSSSGQSQIFSSHHNPQKSHVALANFCLHLLLTILIYKL